MKPGQYSLEQRLVEPFRAIRTLNIAPRQAWLSLFAFFLFLGLWWQAKGLIFNVWIEILRTLISITGEPWVVSRGYWPEFSEPILTLPKLSAAIPPPTAVIWWAFTGLSLGLYAFSGTWKPAFLPLRATTRFILFLLWISLVCFALSPMQFQHSVEEWSKIYFLGAYGSLVIYAIIWTCGVLWFPISTFVKVVVSLMLVLYLIVGTPVLLFMCTLCLHYTSLLLLPLFALAFAPLLQLGWFVCFYSLALSAGTDPRKEVAYE
jgi:hypothetical protein